MNSTKNPFTYFSNFKNALAKPDKSLQEHSFGVTDIAGKILSNFYIHRKYTQYEKDLKEIILLCCYIHDAGKLDKRWQKYIKENPQEKPPIPHPLFSLPIAKEYLEDSLKINSQKIKELLINLGLLSIATHHSPVTNEKYEEYYNWETDYIFKFKKIKPYEIFWNAREEVIKKMNKDIRYFYVLINGILSLSDWIASAPNINFEIFDKEILNKNLNKHFNNKGYSIVDYQKKAKEISNNIIIQLPTGCYKTETALFWLTNQVTNKIFYTLPTVTTVEAMRKRFEDIFNKDKISFSHHLLQISLAKEDRLTDEELFTQKYLLRPIAVTTIDRILLSLMNFHKYTVGEIMLNNAVLIIDEIHSYSPFTFSLIIESLRYLKEYHNLKICVMSATLPTLIKEKLRELEYVNENEFYPLLNENEIQKIYSEKKRTRIKSFLKDKSIEDNLDEILSYIKNYKKVLVVVNTVTKAQNVYKNLKEKIKENIAIILYHSRFIHRHRDEKQKMIECIEKLDKENKLNVKIILISTQIIEVSLDIDFDILFTEIAPVDAIIQRAGRINRKGRKNICDIYIFDVNNDEKGFLPYKKEQIEKAREILNNIKIESEKDYLQINENFYESIREVYNKELKDNKLDKPNDGFLSQIYEKGNIDKALQTRDSFMTIPLFPIHYKKEIERINTMIAEINKELRQNGLKKKEKLENRKLKLIAKKMSYLVPVTLYNAKGNIESINGVEFINLEYDEHLGLKSSKEEMVV